VVEAALPDLSMFPAKSYDLVALLDVLEHVTDDRGSLAAIFERLKPGGALLLTVPINPWLWSAHDVAHHHHRRYRKAEIRKLALDTGYQIELLSPFNSLLFPPIAAVRLAGKLTGKDDSDDAMPPAPVNRCRYYLRTGAGASWPVDAVWRAWQRFAPSALSGTFFSGIDPFGRTGCQPSTHRAGSVACHQP
jgi:SAM-dependent methyltransferase